MSFNLEPLQPLDVQRADYEDELLAVYTEVHCGSLRIAFKHFRVWAGMAVQREIKTKNGPKLTWVADPEPALALDEFPMPHWDITVGSTPLYRWGQKERIERKWLPSPKGGVCVALMFEDDELVALEQVEFESEQPYNAKLARKISSGRLIHSYARMVHQEE